MSSSYGEQQTNSQAGPLKGYKVLELGSTASGPFTTRLMADFGAEVVKIEIASGDPIRFLGETYSGKSLYASSIFRNKKIASIDLSHESGRNILRSMIPSFDVVVENFRPGTLEKWELDYPALSKINPSLVLTRISGYGQTGPYSNRPGYGVIGEAMSGLRRMIGDPDRPPARVAIPLTDYITALYAAFGTVMALLSRKSTGKGQVVDASLIESAFSFMEAWVPAYDKLKVEGKRMGSRLPNSVPNNLFPTADGQFIHIAALADSMFKRLCVAMNKPELAENINYATQQERNTRESEVEQLVSEWTQNHKLDDLEGILLEHGVPATRIYSMRDIFNDPHYKFRNMLVDAFDEDLGTVRLAGVTPILSETPGSVRWAGRRKGQDTREILKTYAGLDDQQINQLIIEKIVVEADSNATNASAAQKQLNT